MKLPKKPLLDASFLIDVFDHEDEVAVEAFQTLEAAAKRGELVIHIAATIYAEMTSKAPPARLPTLFEPVAFGVAAASKLNQHLPDEVIKLSGSPRRYWKFDAMSMACALAAGCDAVIASDPDYRSMLKRAKGITIRVLAPEDLCLPLVALMTKAAKAAKLAKPKTPKTPRKKSKT